MVKVTGEYPLRASLPVALWTFDSLTHMLTRSVYFSNDAAYTLFEVGSSVGFIAPNMRDRFAVIEKIGRICCIITC